LISISLCMIVKNEELNLANCLNSIKDVIDEIIIVDTGSTDKTKEIAKEFTDKIYDFEWIYDFSAARNFSFSKATCDYIMWLDADDLVLKDDCLKLKNLKDNIDTKYDAISMVYDLGFFGDSNEQIQYRRNRLVKRSRNYKWIGFIHEYICVTGNTYESDVHITHTKNHGSSRNLDIYQMKIKEGCKLSSRDTYYYGKELLYNGLYDEAIEVLNNVANSHYNSIEQKFDSIHSLCDIYFHKNMIRNGREILIKAFDLAPPRGETLYRFALSFQLESKFELAISWYEIIDSISKPSLLLGGFVYNKYYTWLPHVQLCVCYYSIGSIEKSKYHNDIAFEMNPNNQYSIANNKFFK
jgi:glycosyltransferase involved in cell wall biosynthesis